jgi:hypothetical protein
MMRNSASPRHLTLWLFATFQFFYLLTSTGRVRTPDEYNTLYTTESLVLHRTTAVPQAVALHNFYGRFDVRGQPRAAYPPGQALAVSPWYAFGQYVLARLPGAPAEDLDLIVGFASCLSSATFAALTVMFFFLLLTGIGIPLRAALLATTILGLATPIFAYSAWLFSEPLSAAMFTFAAWLMFAREGQNPPRASAVKLDERSGSSIGALNGDTAQDPRIDEAQFVHKPASAGITAVAGLILGLSTLVRPTNVLALAVCAVAIVARYGKSALRPILIFLAAGTAGITILLAHNALLFGSPLAFGYPAVAEGAKRLNSFDTPILKGLYGFLLSPGKSIFLFAPPAVLALGGLKALWRGDRALATIAILLPLVDLFFFAKYSQWEGGYCVGPRYLVPGLVFLCLGLGPVLAKGRKSTNTIAAALLVAGLFVQGLSVATSFMEDEAPRGRYYDAKWNYRMDYSLRGPFDLFLKYLKSPEPAKLGLGWDRWFVFLAKGGISRATLAVLLAAMTAGFGISVLGLVKSLAPESRPAPERRGL